MGGNRRIHTGLVLVLLCILVFSGAWEAEGALIGVPRIMRPILAAALRTPVPPSKVEARTFSNSGVVKNIVTWAPSTRLRIRPIGYNIYRSTNAGGPFSKIGRLVKSNRFENPLSQPALFYYRVTEVSKLRRESRPSRTVPAVWPLPPENVTVYAGNLENNISWEPSSVVRYPAKGFNVYRAKHEDGPYSKIGTLPATGVSYADPIAADEVGVYWYRISEVALGGRESERTVAEPNLYVRVSHRFRKEGCSQVTAANGKLNFFMPDGALTQDTTITIAEQESAPTSEGVKPVSFAFDFSPDGLTFPEGKEPLFTVPYYLPLSDPDLNRVVATWLQLYYFDESSQSVVKVDQSPTVDFEARRVTFDLPHFTTYWTGAKVNPHGTYGQGTDYCGICHSLHGASTTEINRWTAVDVCVQCHGNTNSTDPPAGAGISQPAPNIQAEFLDCADQTGGGPSESGYSWTQTSLAEFLTDNLTTTVTTDVAGGEVILDSTPAVPGDPGSSFGRSDDFEDGTIDPTWTISSVNISPSPANASEAGGQLTFNAGGNVNWGITGGQSSDNYGYMWKTGFTGDATFTLSLTSVTGNNDRSTFLMIRQGPAVTGSVFFAVGYDRTPRRDGILYRNTTNAASTFVTDGTNDTTVLLRIVRAGTNYSGYYSNDGSTWTQLGATQNMSNLGYGNYGIALSNGTDIVTEATGVYDYIAVTPDGTPATPGVPGGFKPEGWATSTEIIPVGLKTWDQLSWSANKPASTTFEVGIRGWNGSSWTGLATATVSPYDLSTIDATTYTRLMLRGHMTTSLDTTSPTLEDWTVTATRTVAPGSVPNGSTHPVPELSMRCDACHTPHRAIGDYTDLLRAKTGPAWLDYTYSTSTTPLGNEFCWICHGTAVNMYPVLKGQVTTAAYFTESRGDHRTGYGGVAAHDVALPTSGAVPQAWVPPTSALGDRQGVSQSTQIRCLNCHYHHGSSQSKALTGYRLTTAYDKGVEETLCYQCHTPSWSAGMKDMVSEFSKAYRHPVASTTYTHSYNEDVNGWNDRHVECVDCHNTHKAQQGTHTAGTNAAMGAVVGVWGVSPTYSGTGPVSGWNVTSSATREYMICLKCHSSYDKTYDTVAYQDLAAKVNPNNPSYHPLATAGRNTTEPAATFSGAWNATSRMYCSDCHESDSATIGGPHGSAVAKILPRNYTTTSRINNATFLCYICHNYNTYYAGSELSSRFEKTDGTSLHYTHVNDAKSPKMNCAVCHETHGSTTNQRLMVVGRGINAWNGPAANSYSTSTCNTSGCHGSDDNCYSCHGEAGSVQKAVYLMGRGAVGYVSGGSSKTYHHIMTSPTTAYSGTSADPPTTSITTNTCEGRCHAKHAEHTGTSAKSLRAGNSARNLCLYCHGVAGGALPAKTFSSVSYAASDHPAWIASTLTSGYTENKWNATVGGTNYKYFKSCTPCHAPHGSDVRYMINEVVENRSDELSANYLTQSVSESQRGRLCTTCHGSKGPGVWNVSSAFAKSYTHPVFNGTATNHRASTSDLLGAGNRHVTCEDCHNPHTLKVGKHVAPTNGVSGDLTGVWGAVPNNGATTGTVSGWTTTNAASKEYMVCLKCHSTFATGAPVDVGASLNTNNPAYHPIETAGRNPTVSVATFVAPWNATGTMYCSDCHNNDTSVPAGPHGSTNSYILARTYSTEARTGTGFLCYKCHNYDTYYTGIELSSRFEKADGAPLHQKHVNESFGAKMLCWRCHQSHGSATNQRMMVVGRGINAFNGPSPNNYSTATCATTGCHGADSDCYSCHGEAGGVQKVVYLMGRGAVGYVSGGSSKTYHHIMTSPTTAYSGTSADPPTTSITTNTCEGRCHAKHAEHTGSDAKSLRASNNEGNLCLFCHGLATSPKPARTLDSVSFSGSAHNYTTTGYTENNWNATVDGTKYQYQKRCAKCHAPHGSDIKYQINEVVENLGNTASPNYTTVAVSTEANRDRACTACHGAKGPAPKNIASEFTKAYTHNIYSTGQAGRHIAGTQALTSANRHVLCEDCHNAHRARPGTHTGQTNAVAGVLRGVWGVSINNGAAAGAIPVGNFSTITSASYEYQICLKCHSNWAQAPVDIAAKVNTNNPSYHPIQTAGKNSGIPAATFAGGWVAANRMHCSDCHGSDNAAIAGPHGATTAYILSRDYATASRSSSTGFLCYKCHNYSTYYAGSELSSRFEKADGTSLHFVHVNESRAAKVTCWRCHESHGSSTLTRLITTGRGIDGFTPNANNYSMGDCATSGCHGGGDNNCYGCHGEGGNPKMPYLMGRGASGYVYPGTSRTYHHIMTSPTTAFTGTSTDVPSVLTTTNTCEGRCHRLHGEHTGATSSGAKSLRESNNEKNLCLYCHGVAGRPYPAKTLSSTSYNSTVHNYTTAGQTENRWNPSVAGTPYQYQKNCGKCHTPHGSNVKYNLNEVVENRGFTWAGNYTTRTVSSTTVEQVCYGCHQAKGPGPDVETAVVSSTLSYHPVSSVGMAGRHQAGTETLSNATRHVECQDCHNAHQAGTTSHIVGSQGQIGTINRGVWGVTASLAGSLGNPTTTYSAIAAPQVTKLWQVCAKCHSRFGWTTPPRTISTVAGTTAYSTETDVLNDFNPNQYAYHPLFTAGRNQPPTSTYLRGTTTNVWDSNAQRRFASGGGISNTFVDGWTSKSLVTCTDCHNKPATKAAWPDGPHGSTFKWLLKGQDPTVGVTLWNATVVYPNDAGGGVPKAAANFCTNCHRGDVYGHSSSYAPNSTADSLSRIQHMSDFRSNCMRTFAKDGDGVKTLDIGCLNCHGGNKAGSIHGSSQPTGPEGGDIMGKRFTNGASWLSHELGDVSPNTIGCSTKGSEDAVNKCTSHTSFGQSANPVYYYPWQ